MADTARLLRRLLPIISAAVLLALFYDAWVFYSRWHSAREMRRAQAEAEARQARRTLDLLGGAGLKILNFYASPASIRRGEQTNLCYGVTGAKTVRMEPASPDVHPALSHCLKVSPRADTEYKLIVEDGAGHAVTARVTINVRPPR